MVKIKSVKDFKSYVKGNRRITEFSIDIGSTLIW